MVRSFMVDFLLLWGFLVECYVYKGEREERERERGSGKVFG